MSISTSAWIARDATTAGQIEAEALMTEPCVIDRLTDGMVRGEDGIERPSERVIVYEGPCKVQTHQPYEQSRDVSGSLVTIQRYELDIPAPERMPALIAAGVVKTWAGPVDVGDRSVVSGVRPLRVAGPHDKTYQTAQRMLVDEGAS